MERADWLEEQVDAADARFLMVTAITHHRFSSPIWGAREVRKLHAELAEIAKHASEVLKEHQAAARSRKAEEAAPDFEVPRRLRRPRLVRRLVWGGEGRSASARSCGQKGVGGLSDRRGPVSPLSVVKSWWCL